jgi:hypothetical protein
MASSSESLDWNAVMFSVEAVALVLWTIPRIFGKVIVSSNRLR